MQKVIAALSIYKCLSAFSVLFFFNMKIKQEVTEKGNES